MKFEAGKYYKTRSGRKAFVAATENPFRPSNAFRMCGFIEGYSYSMAWTSDGRSSLISEDIDDLIAEWKEPVTFTTWLALWSDGSATCFSYKPDSLLSNCIAIKPVTITEGEGMQ